MISFVGYNFCSDINCIDPFPTNISNEKSVELRNGIFDHIHVSSDVTSEYSSVIPSGWDFDTIMDCDFSGNVDAGDISAIVENIQSVKIKRRQFGSFDWITIKEIEVTQPSDLTFAFTDNLTVSDMTYEYAFVPIINNSEGSYITNTVFSKFTGVFICDADTVYRFYSGAQYGTTTSVQKVGVFEPFSRQFPVVVTNGTVDYQHGEISGRVLPADYDIDRIINRKDIVDRRDAVVKFLTNKKPKVIKDWNGNVWLVFITGDVNTDYDNNFGMGMVTVSASWTEIGDFDSKTDLYKAGLIPTEV